MNKKKWLSFGIPVAASAVLLVVSGFTVSAGTSGYEAYKSALKNSDNISSVTTDFALSVTDNGKSVLDAKANIKLDEEGEGTNANFSINNGTDSRQLQVYHQGDQVIVKNSADDTYYTLDTKENSRKIERMEREKWEAPEEIENVIDALVGNLKQQISLEEGADGKQEVSLHMSGNQLPPIVNAAGSLMIKFAGEHKEFNADDNNSNSFKEQLFGEEFDAAIPDLTEDIRIEAVNIDATINKDNQLEHQAFEIEVTGKDEAGQAHEVKVAFKADFTNFNGTVAEEIDLQGKKVEAIDPKAWKERKHH
ncbi:hypothetical protein K0T92_21775 [Paenibacillus oenotherae]|uniref:DUF4179 domain-containing protein n=1 Tax=Paenibacillus oenotherae TaxID=1435645 RepID=A0ABS7DDV5_9BACL|nr:hypothetical protein [Paenibacillus oenotherae]MBW7477353.1 hypothetical protein [Paenibacillus oenotherae]